jgi:hypothetical protein
MFSPNNLCVYIYAICGYNAGLNASRNQPTSAHESDYADAAVRADLFAQAVDAAWGIASYTNADLQQIQSASAALLAAGASPVPGEVGLTSSGYANIAIALVAGVRAGTAQIVSEGLNPNGCSGGGGSSSEAGVLFSALSTLFPATPTSIQYVNGYFSVGDGGQGSFLWNAASTTAPDGGTIVKVTGIAVGRWQRIYSGPLSPAWYGADATGTFDSLVETTLCFTAAALGYGYPTGSVLFDPGSYLYSDTLTQPNSITVRGNGIKTRLLFGGVGQGYTWSNPLSALSGQLHDLTIENLGSGTAGLVCTDLIGARSSGVLAVGWGHQGMQFVDCSLSTFDTPTVTFCGDASHGAMEFDSAAVDGGQSQNIGNFLINPNITNNASAVAGLRFDRGGPFTTTAGTVSNSGVPVQIASKAETTNGCAGITFAGLDIEIPVPSASTPAFIESGYGLTGLANSRVAGLTIQGCTLVVDSGGIPYGIKCKYTDGFSFSSANDIGTEFVAGTTLGMFWFEGLTCTNMVLGPNRYVVFPPDPFVVVNGTADPSAIPGQLWSYAPQAMGGGTFGASEISLPGRPIAAPATPSTGYILFIDSADNKLKAIGSSGTVTILAVP